MAKRPVKIFLDSNVIISGIFSDKGSPRITLDILCLDLPFIVGATGKYNIIEIERNLKRKMPNAFPLYQKYIPNLDLEIIPLPSKKEIETYLGYTSDKDVPVLVSAIKGKADFLITGDKKDFSGLKKHINLKLKILNPSEFLDIFRRLHENFQSK
jgi:predicted nucleic acid-binding protein